MRPETYYSLGDNLTAGSSNTIFTVPNGYEARVTMVYISNNTGSSKSFSASWFHSGTEIQFAASKSLNSTDFIQYGGDFGDFFVMDEGDYMTITPEAGSTFVSILSFILLKHDGTKFNL
jgi:hypothetical protein